MIETWGNNRKGLQGKPSKTELVQQLGDKYQVRHLDIYSMTNKDLTTLVKRKPKVKPEIAGRSNIKKPYVEILETLYPTVKTFNRLSLDGLRNLLEAICKNSEQ